MPGVVAVTFTLLPRVLEGEALPMPVWALSLLSLGQSSALLALAVWAGVALAPAVGLEAPAFTAAVTGGRVGAVLRPRLLPGAVAGLLGGVLLHTAWRYAPAAFAEASERLSLPLGARVLYGGVTEELLLRWGLMTLLAWLAWRASTGGGGAPAVRHLWLAIAVSALVFGAGHLPAAAALVGALDAGTVVWVVGVNTVFGVLFGYSFYRWGLETAILAHAMTHVVYAMVALA